MIPDRDSAIASLEKAEHISQKIDSGNESELGKAVNELKSAIRSSSHDGIETPIGGDGASGPCTLLHGGNLDWLRPS